MASLCGPYEFEYLVLGKAPEAEAGNGRGLAGALGWPINEARRLAGYPESDDNLTPLEVEEPGREMIKNQIIQLIDFVSKCEQTSVTGGSGEVRDIKPVS